MSNRTSAAACKEHASSKGSINSVDTIDKKTLEWIEAGLPGLSSDNLQAVLARFFKEQDSAKVTTATTPAKAANAAAAAPAIAGNAQAQSQRGGIPPAYPPPTTHTQRGGSSYYRTTTAPQSGHLPAGQMPTFTYTPPAFAQGIMPPPSLYARVGAQRSTKTGAQRSEKTAARPSTKTDTAGRPLPPTWTGAPKPATGATKAAANAQKNAQQWPRAPAAPREPAASRMPGASRSTKRKVRSGSLERASVQRSAKKAAQAPAPSEA
ncbi:hypothetical protein EV122DRAFT_256363 [Schizophyllum commune]